MDDPEIQIPDDDGVGVVVHHALEELEAFSGLFVKTRVLDCRSDLA